MVGRSGCLEGIALRDRALVCIGTQDNIAVERSGGQLQDGRSSLGLLLEGNLNVTIDDAFTCQLNSIAGIVAPARVGIEGLAAFLGSDLGILNNGIAVVRRKDVADVVRALSSIENHVVKSQVRVVLDHHLHISVVGDDRTVLEGYLVVLQKLECLCFSA